MSVPAFAPWIVLHVKERPEEFPRRIANGFGNNCHSLLPRISIKLNRMFDLPNTRRGTIQMTCLKASRGIAIKQRTHTNVAPAQQEDSQWHARREQATAPADPRAWDEES
jgi:hypothetical protein